MKKAQFYHKLKNNIVQCVLCPHYCIIKNDDFGKCKVRKNIDGRLYSLSYEHPVALNVDPVEKKPLYHFLPGEKAFSVGMAGCNLKCQQCQNWDISQKGPEELPTPKVSAKEVIERSKELNCPMTAYTYSEPLVSLEYVYETAKLAKKQGIKNIIVSNGFINPGPLKKLCRYIDGANIDLKSISDRFYREICSAKIEPVLETLKVLKQEGIWTEITNLIVPTLNDSEKDIKELVEWIKENLGTATVLHFTAFYPCYKLLELPPTPLEKLKKARKIAIESGMKYVYTGNLPDEEGNNTYCPKCGKMLIKRRLFSITENNLNKGKCPKCHAKIYGFWTY
ncbi:AmmeMemoRadiSam system radical SAM enzyme [Candidatus Pacearchaeota archaeon RBG_13_36_9]|nr:MAG: AmmeMemoRadiSam system radical SAM enzyme [Candidatus Pacearchaeota archaeon RBG_13_36_9]